MTFSPKRKAMERFPDGAILVTIDLVGLYPKFLMMKVWKLCGNSEQEI